MNDITVNFLTPLLYEPNKFHVAVGLLNNIDHSRLQNVVRTSIKLAKQLVCHINF